MTRWPVRGLPAALDADLGAAVVEVALGHEQSRVDVLELEPLVAAGQERFVLPACESEQAPVEHFDELASARQDPVEDSQFRVHSEQVKPFPIAQQPVGALVLAVTDSILVDVS